METCGARRSGRGDAGGAGLRRALDGRDGPRPVLPAAARRRSTTERVELGTGIAVAFARNPMTLAQIACDLQAASEGRFILGLGSQIKPHITKRFSMPWSHPAARMREMILAIRAIWASLERRHQARLPGRLLHAHPDDAVLQPGPEPARRRQDLPRRRRRADDRGGRRGVRRLPLPRLHHRALPPRGHAPRPRAGRAPRPAARWPTSRSPARPSWSPAPTRRRWPASIAGTQAADRVLRLHARLPRRARAPRLGRPPGRAQRDVEGGQVGGDGRAHRRRDPRHLRRRRRAREARRRAAASATATSSSRISFYAPYASDPDRWRAVMEQLHAV